MNDEQINRRHLQKQKENISWDVYYKDQEVKDNEANRKQNLTLRQVYDLLRFHIDDRFIDPGKCEAFNECYEIITRYYSNNAK